MARPKLGSLGARTLIPMGIRPPHLNPGQLSPIASYDSTDFGGELGRAEPGTVRLLVFERGHWCDACRRHLSQLAAALDRIEAFGADLVVVTHESAHQIGIHQFPVIADPDLTIGTAFGICGADEFGKFTLRPTTLLIDENGRILFSYVGGDSRDRPTVAELLLILDRFTPHSDQSCAPGSRSRAQ
jgi:peroxiredoxin